MLKMAYQKAKSTPHKLKSGPLWTALLVTSYAV